MYVELDQWRSSFYDAVPKALSGFDASTTFKLKMCIERDYYNTRPY